MTPIPSLARSEKRLRFLDGLAQATRALSQPADVMQVTARLLGEHLQASRCAYATVEDDQDHFHLFGDHNRGVASIVGRYAFTEFGAVVQRLMREDRPYVNPDVETHPLTAGTDLSAYLRTQIRAVVWVPLHKDGRFVAAMAVHQSAPRDWSHDEVELLRTVVDRCWEALDRIRSESALREAHQRLSLAFAAGELSDWSWDAATDLVSLGDRACSVFGLGRGERIGWLALRERLHEDDREPARRAIDTALREHGTYAIEYRVLRPGGPLWLAAQGKGVYAADGRVLGMTGILQDVTARRLAQDRARSEADMLELLNRTGAALAGDLDLQSLLQRVTDAATQLTGARFGAFFYNGTDEQGDALLLYTLAGAPKAAFENLGHPRPTALFGPTFNGGPPIRCADVTQDPRYGRWGPHHGMPPGHLPLRSYLAVPVVARSGTAIGGLFFGHPQAGVFTERSERLALGVAAQAAIAIDNARLYAEAQRAVEERKALLESERAARREAERASAVKDEFLATLSHELRTPLSAILGWVHLLRRQPIPPEAERRKGVDVIERNARVQLQLIEDLLDMSRITSGKLRLNLQPVAPVSFVQAALDTVRPAAEAAGVAIEARLDASVGTVVGDPARLQQVVWNLLSNAVKFTPSGGRVEVTVEGGPTHIEIAVEDSGDGIPAEFLPHLFDRFRQADGSITRRHGGLGLGLSIVRHLTEAHGGEVLAASDGPGRGARFRVRLPLQAAAAGPDMPCFPDLLPAEDTDLSGVRVLVVDDEQDSRELLRRILEDCGAQVRTAPSAEAALELLPLQRPDVLVSDIGMPGTDGYELLRRVRLMGAAQGGDVPAIAVTAFARTEDRVRALRAGYSVHVAKPMEPLEIVATVASVAGRTGARR